MRLIAEAWKVICPKVGSASRFYTGQASVIKVEDDP